MAIRMPRIIQAKQLLKRSSSSKLNCASSVDGVVPRGHFAVYVGEGEKRRYVIPVAYLNQPSFQALLSQAEEEFGFDHPILGGLSIPCTEEMFIGLTSRLSRNAT